jgi:hypothetical protein
VVAPVGPTGCEGAARGASYFVGAAAGAMRTRLRFDNDATFALTEQAVTALVGYATPAGWSVRVSVGALVDGRVDSDGMLGTHDLDPGVVGGLAVARQWTFGGGQWFVTGTAGVSVAAASTHQAGLSDEPRFVAADARVGAIAGRTLAKIWNPYLLARGFGGPVWWTVAGADTTGADTHHFQVGAGLSVATELGLTIVLDVSVLGEQAASLGVSWRM